jgi:hypothetical protein
MRITEAISMTIKGIHTLDVNIAFHGNSLTQGRNNTPIDQYYPKKVRDGLSPLVNSLTFNSVGVSGRAMTEMISDAPSVIDGFVNVNKLNVIVFWEDVNGIYIDGRTGQQNFDDYETYALDRKNAGWDLVIPITGYFGREESDGGYVLYNYITGQYIDFSGVVQSSWFDRQEDFFDLVDENGVTNSDEIVHLSVSPILGGGRDQVRDPNYFSDYIHLVADGYDEVARLVLIGVLRALQSQT